MTPWRRDSERRRKSGGHVLVAAEGPGGVVARSSGFVGREADEDQGHPKAIFELARRRFYGVAGERQPRSVIARDDEQGPTRRFVRRKPVVKATELVVEVRERLREAIERRRTLE